MATSGLVNLPTEVLFHICSMFCCHCSPVRDPKWLAQDYYSTDTEALACLSRTCKALRGIAQPIIYHAPECCAPGLLLRTLLERPNLARSVHSISFPEYREEFEESDFPVIKDAARQLGISLPEGWCDDFEDESDQLTTRLLDLLLASLPEIKALEYTMSLEVSPSALLDGTAITFPSLQSIRLRHWDAEGGFDLEDADALFKKAPNLTSLEAEMCVALPSGLTLATVKVLHFAESHLTDQNIKDIILSCPQLEEFAYSSAGEGVTQYAEEPEFALGVLMEALKTRKETLRHLDLFIGEKYGVTAYMEPTESSMEYGNLLGSFASFPVLKTLIVQSAFLCEEGQEEDLHRSGRLVSLLPRSLGFLALRGRHRSDEGPVPLVQAIGRGEFPSLKTVAFTVAEVKLQQFKQMYAAVGVGCVVYQPSLHGLQSS